MAAAANAESVRKSVGVADSAHLVYGIHASQSRLDRRPQDVRGAWLLDGPGNAALQALRVTLGRHGIQTRAVARAELDRLSDGGTHQGVVLEVAPPAALDLAGLEGLVTAGGRSIRLLVLDQVEDPRNLGACLRTADAAGVHAIVVPKAHSARLTPAALKAATGAADTVPLAVVPNLARALRWLKEAGVWVIGTDGDAPTSIHAARLETPVAVVLGAEGRGLRRLTRETCDELVSIPMHGTVQSLNVSVAAGVVLFELARQVPPVAVELSVPQE